MSFKLSRNGFGLPLVGLVIGALVSCGALAQTPVTGKGQAGAAPTGSSVTRSNRLESGKTRLQALEETLTRSLQPFVSKQPLETEMPPPVYRPPVAPVMQNTRVKEMLDRRKNWMLMTPEDMILGKDRDNPLQLPDDLLGDRDPKASSPYNSFSNNSSRRRSGSRQDPLLLENDPMGLNNDPMGLNKPSSPREPKRPGDDSDLPSGIRESEATLKRMLGSDAGRNVPSLGGNSTFADFFGLGSRSSSAADEAAHKAYMQGYRQLLENSTPTLTGGSVPGYPGMRTVENPGGLDPLGTARRNLDGSTAGGLGSLLNPGVLPDANTKVLNQWNPLYTPTRPEPPKPPSTSVPTVSLPRRKF